MEALNIFIATTQFLLCIFLICHGVKVLKESKESIRIAEARLEIAKSRITREEYDARLINYANKVLPDKEIN